MPRPVEYIMPRLNCASASPLSAVSYKLIALSSATKATTVNVKPNSTGRARLSKPQFLDGGINSRDSLHKLMKMRMTVFHKGCNGLFLFVHERRVAVRFAPLPWIQLRF